MIPHARRKIGAGDGTGPWRHRASVRQMDSRRRARHRRAPRGAFTLPAPPDARQRNQVQWSYPDRRRGAWLSLCPGAAVLHSPDGDTFTAWAHSRLRTLPRLGGHGDERTTAPWERRADYATASALAAVLFGEQAAPFGTSFSTLFILGFSGRAWWTCATIGILCGQGHKGCSRGGWDHMYDGTAARHCTNLA